MKKYTQVLPIRTDCRIDEQFGWLPLSVIEPTKESKAVWSEAYLDDGENESRRSNDAEYLPGLKFSEFHAGLAEQILRYWSMKGSVVVDPFAGRATRAVVANKLGRQYEGYEISPSTYKRSKEHFKNLEGLTISWFGDMNNVLYSLCQVLELLGNMKLNIFTHKDISERNKQRFNFKFTNIYHKIEKSIISNSDCIMTDVYSSMNDGKNDNASLLKPFRVDEELMSYTNKEAIFMHCLPANIDSEVTLAVLKSNKSITLKQAYNRLVAQRGILKWLVS